MNTAAEEEPLRIGVDLGGTKIEAIGLRAEGLRFHRRTATPGDYRAIVRSIAEIARAAETELACRATLGIAAPGSPAPRSGLWRNCNIVSCNGRDLAGDLAEAFGRPIRIENDANCFTLSEAIEGAGVGCRVVFGITLGTGLGGGLVVDGVLRPGPNGNAAEIGHIPLPWPGPEDLPPPACYCGGAGCAERYLSGTGLAADFLKETGKSLDGAEIIEAAGMGNAAASRVVERFADRLARLVGVLVNVLDPDVFVFGGGVSSAEAVLGRVVQSASNYAFGPAVQVKIRRAANSDAGARGAAMLWREQDQALC